MAQEGMVASAVKVLGVLADLLQVGAVAYAAFALWRARRKLLAYLQTLQKSQSARPFALVISFGGDIRGQVEAYLKDQKLDIPVRSYKSDYFAASQFIPILQELQAIKDELTDVGVTEVHVFYKGPVTMAMALGALTDNWVPIRVYAFEEGTFKQVITLEKRIVKGLMAGRP